MKKTRRDHVRKAARQSYVRVPLPLPSGAVSASSPRAFSSNNFPFFTTKVHTTLHSHAHTRTGTHTHTHARVLATQKGEEQGDEKREREECERTLKKYFDSYQSTKTNSGNEGGR